MQIVKAIDGWNLHGLHFIFLSMEGMGNFTGV